MNDTAAKKIGVYERYSDGEITEAEVRELLGDDVVDSIEEEREAFETAMERDTSVFLSNE